MEAMIMTGLGFAMADGTWMNENMEDNTDKTRLKKGTSAKMLQICLMK
jgi:hypothetical protein